MNESERIRFDAIVEQIPDTADNILDVGCARHNSEKREKGNLHEYLHENTNARILGIDVLEQQINKMKLDGYDVEQGDIESLNLNERFDVIVMGEVIEHILNHRDMLESLYTHLSEQGKVIITTPNPDGFGYFRKALFRQSNNQTHTCWVDPSNLHRMVAMYEQDLYVDRIKYLPPSGGVSHLLWKAGYKRVASPGYIAVLSR